MVSLKSCHILLDSFIVKKIFGDIHYAYATYSKEQNVIMTTSVSSQWFVKMYEKYGQFLLKTKNLKGDKSLAIKELLIDGELDMTDRELSYEIIEKTNLLKIKI